VKLKEWATITEITASFAVIISLVLLVVEVRGNTLAIERQIDKDHRRAIFTPVIDPPILLSAMERIRAVDGQETHVQAFMETYDLNDAEVYVWGNFQLMIWTEMQQDFVNNGPSERLAAQIHSLAIHSDVALFVENFESSGGFKSYIDGVVRDADLQ
jgi:hypothetical protein